MSRLNRKKFDDAYDRCWVSIPKGDFDEMRHHHFNGMENQNIRNDLLELYRYVVTSKCDAKFKRWLGILDKRKGDSMLEKMLWNDLFYYYASRAEYEWWLGDKKINWFDPNDEGTWQQVLDGCKPLFELFEEIECLDSQ